MKWEYTWVSIDGKDVTQVRKLGQEGWEAYFMESLGNSGTNGAHRWQVWMKRPVGGWRCPTCQAMHDAVEALG